MGWPYRYGLFFSMANSKTMECLCSLLIVWFLSSCWISKSKHIKFPFYGQKHIKNKTIHLSWIVINRQKLQKIVVNILTNILFIFRSYILYQWWHKCIFWPIIPISMFNSCLVSSSIQPQSLFFKYHMYLLTGRNLTPLRTFKMVFLT